MNKFLIIFFFISLGCSTGKLTIIADLPKNLKEASAIEKAANSDLLWTIEDSGNKNNIYGLNLKGEIVKDIDIKNASNIDWEDLTSDKAGNLYIGDFGNNSKNRDDFTIYKISDLNKDKTEAERINFILPKKVKPKDFEAFFIWNNHFYIFSKENKSSMLFKVPNKVGLHTAELIKKFNLEEELAKGDHTYPIPDLFPKNEEYQNYLIENDYFDVQIGKTKPIFGTRFIDFKHMGAPKHVSDFVYDLHTKAVELGGEYDGLGCTATRSAPES